MRIATIFLAGALSLVAGAALSSCPAQPPAQNWTTQSGDRRTNMAYLENLLKGRRVIYDGVGVEQYESDGRYTYRENGKSYTARYYRFYDTGVRCIGYQPVPRFDLYVVNDKSLVLINGRGVRYPGKVTK